MYNIAREAIKSPTRKYMYVYTYTRKIVAIAHTHVTLLHNNYYNLANSSIGKLVSIDRHTFLSS